MKKLICLWLTLALSVSFPMPISAQISLPLLGVGSGGGGGLFLNPGFTWVQDGFWGSSACSTSSTTCSGSSCSNNGSCALPTTAGTIRIITFATGNTNINFDHLTQANEAWTVCSTCHIYNAGYDDMGLAYSYGTYGGELPSTITLTFTGDPVGYIQVNEIEILPPSGYTAAFDIAGVNSSVGCSTCTGVGLAVTGTDAELQLMDNDAPQVVSTWNGYSSPYITDNAQNGVCLNCTATAAPTYTLPGSAYQAVIGIAFKITAGSFTPPTPVFTLANYENYGSGTLVSCSPGCGPQTIPSTGSGHLLMAVVQTYGSASYLSSSTGGGTWACVSGLRVNDGGGNYGSLCYVLSSSSGATSFTPTMTANASVGIGYFEVSSTCPNGISVDTSNATQNAGSGTYYFNGQALTLSGGSSANDAILQFSVASGGVSSLSLYPVPNFYLLTGSAGAYAGSVGLLLNTANGAAPVYSYPQETGATGVFAIAFKCT